MTPNKNGNGKANGKFTARNGKVGHRALPAGRFDGVERPYTDADVEKLRGSVRVEHTLADRGARKLWELMEKESYINALGALTGNQAMQMVRAGLKAIYLSGWQVAADANVSGQMYPDQSLYPVNSVPTVVKRINQALQRADQIECAEGEAEPRAEGESPGLRVHAVDLGAELAALSFDESNSALQLDTCPRPSAGTGGSGGAATGAQAGGAGAFRSGEEIPEYC